MSFLDADVEDKDEVYCEETLKAIQQILSENYNFADGCHNVKTNKRLYFSIRV